MINNLKHEINKFSEIIEKDYKDKVITPKQRFYMLKEIESLEVFIENKTYNMGRLKLVGLKNAYFIMKDLEEY